MFFAQLSAAQKHASIKRLASGSKLSNPSDDPAGVAVSSRLDALSRSISAASESQQTLTSFAQTSDGFLKVANDQLSRLGELAIRAQNGALSASDRANLNVEFTKIRDNVMNQVNNASFNGSKVFDTNQTVGAPVDGSGNTNFNLTIPDAAGDLAGIANSDISTPTNAQAALDAVNQAMDRISSDRAKVNSDISALNSYQQSNDINGINTRIANSRIADVDYADESTNLAKAGILNQAALAAVYHSNINRQNVLNILR